jgi:hypothetical protein
MRALVFLLVLGWLAPASAVTVESQCNAAKLKATGAYVQRILACQATAIQKGLTIDHECTARAAAKLAKAFANAENKDDCGGSGPAAGAQEFGDEFRIDALDILPAQTCCHRVVDGNDQCFYRVSDAECTSLGYEPGVTDSICDSLTGRCVTSSTSNPGECCENATGTCFAGELAPGECAGSTLVPNGVCLATGECLPD